MKMLAMIITAVMLTACASSSVYKEARGSGFGYQDSALSETQHRISYKSRGNDSGKAHDLAMLRAAELTLLKGYDWFEVLDRETIKDKSERSGASMGISQRTEVTESCGLLGCKRTTRPSREYSMGVDVGNDRDSVERHLEILLGNGVRPNKSQVYNATEVRENIRKKYDL